MRAKEQWIEPNPQTVEPPKGAGKEFYNAEHYADPTAWQALQQLK